MAIAHVATVYAYPGAPGGTTSSIDTTGANLLILAVSWYFGTISTLSDSKGNTWFPLTTQFGFAFRHKFYYAKNAIVGTGHTFTVADTTIYPLIVAHAFSGASTNPFDVENGTFVASGASPSGPGSITPTANGALIVSGIAGNMTAAPHVSPSMTETTFQADVAGANVGGGTGWLIQSTAAAINPSWSWVGTSEEVPLTVASFLPAVTPSVGTESSVTFVRWPS